MDAVEVVNRMLSLACPAGPPFNRNMDSTNVYRISLHCVELDITATVGEVVRDEQGEYKYTDFHVRSMAVVPMEEDDD